MHRVRDVRKTTLTLINDREFLDVFRAERKLQDVMLKIRHIDTEKNGCVTKYELDDIIKEVYP